MEENNKAGAELLAREVKIAEATGLKMTIIPTVYARQAVDYTAELEQTSRAQRTSIEVDDVGGLTRERIIELYAEHTFSEAGDGEISFAFDIAREVLGAAQAAGQAGLAKLDRYIIDDNGSLQPAGADIAPNLGIYLACDVMEFLAAPVAADTEQATDYVLMPRKLTAENGAKGALMGEFKETYMVECHECEGSGEDEHDYPCPECKGDGEVQAAISVGWDTIKDIYARAVELLAAPLATPADAGADKQTAQQQKECAPPFAAPASQHEAIVGAVARGWCAPANENKIMDEELAYAIVAEVEKLLSSGFREGRNTKPESNDNSPAPVTAEPAVSIADNHKFRELLDEFAYRASERRALGGDYGSAEAEGKAEEALIEFFDGHIAPAPADRDAILEDAALQCEAEKVHVQKWHPSSDGDEAYNTGCDDCAKSIRALKSMVRAADAKGDQQ